MLGNLTFGLTVEHPLSGTGLSPVRFGDLLAACVGPSVDFLLSGPGARRPGWSTGEASQIIDVREGPEFQKGFEC